MDSDKAQNKQVRFDESLSAFVGAILPALGRDAVEHGYVVRDANGRLVFIARGELSPKQIQEASESAIAAVAAYVVDASFVVLLQQESGIETLTSQRPATTEHVQINDGTAIKISLVDNRIVGSDWLCRPAKGWRPPAIPRIVFASMKGGVGRSTALTVLAADLALDGKKVLVVDLDLEAPGIGSMLLEEANKPEYGALDWFVESRLSQHTESLLLEMVSSSHFPSGSGLINVVPAVGRSSDAMPNNVLAKLARAYVEQPDELGNQHSFLQRTQQLITLLEDQLSYDAVLIDARAGLNESTSASILGLGADVLLFGVNTPQTITSYRYLLAHLARFNRDPVDDWLLRLRMVHAHASPDPSNQALFRDRTHSMFSEFLYGNVPLLDAGGSPLHTQDPAESIEQFSVDDPTGPHYAWPVLWDSTYADFDPVSKPTLLSTEYYKRTFSGLIEGVRELIEPLQEGI
jgi:hypothetical protein